MRYYTATHFHKILLPSVAYKDRLIVLEWMENINRFDARYSISFDLKTFVSYHRHVLILFNLMDEDFTHLRLLDIPIRYPGGIELPALTEAIANKEDTFIYAGPGI